MRIINLVDSLASVNFGIWNAAVATAPALKQEHGVDSWVVYPQDGAAEDKLEASIGRYPINQVPAKEGVAALVQSLKLDPAQDIIATHGSWRYPTIWGRMLRQQGFAWVYCPQGMLEPWSMSQKWLKKRIYFELREKPMARQASLIRAVSRPELDNLNKVFSQTQLIANGVNPLAPPPPRPDGRTRFVFMARLHHKKGIMPLVQAWLAHFLNNPAAELVIAGPDDGEKAQLQQALASHGGANIKFIGPIYGADKKQLLHSAHFYVLPSYSEGFPSSVVEAMNHGCIPVISDGCNFPESFEAGIGIKCTPDVATITEAIKQALAMSDAQRQELSRRSWQFINSGYTSSIIAAQQYQGYKALL